MLFFGKGICLGRSPLALNTALPLRCLRTNVATERNTSPFSFAKKPERGRSKPTLDSGLIARVVKMRIIKNMTKNGKYVRYSAFMAVGNGRGSVGVSHAKSIDAVDAVAKATKSATKNMQYYERFQFRTIFHDDIVKFKSTKVHIRPAPPNTGRRCHPAIAEICRCAGIQDISANVHGSRHAPNVAQAFLKALARQKSPEMVAKETGYRVLDIMKVYQHGCPELTRTLRAERYANTRQN